MGFLDELKKLTHPYEDEDEDFLDEAEEAEEPRPQKRSNPFAGFSFGAAPAQESESEQPKPAAARPAKGKVVNFSSNAAGPMQLMLAKPERFEAAAEIADNLRDGRAVLMNLETTSKEISRRLIDFLSGVAYAQGGRIKKVSANTYIITPNGVNLMGDLMDELESTGFYF